MAEIVFGEKLENVQYRERPSIYAIIFNEHGQLGVVKVQGKSKYFLPGGGEEPGETHAACLARECREELGWSIKVGDLVGTAEHYSYNNPLQCYLKISAYFYKTELCAVTGGKVETDHELLWLNPEEASQNLMLEHQQWAVRKVLAERGMCAHYR